MPQLARETVQFYHFSGGLGAQKREKRKNMVIGATKIEKNRL
jgi:hypothetical protein